TEITGIGEICVAKDGSLFLVDAVSDSLATQVLDLLNDLLSKEAPVCDSSFQALQKLLGNSYNEEEYVDAHISGLVCVNDIQSESCTPVYRLTTINTERSAQNSTEQSIVIPSWIKNNAKWWSNKQISDSEFIKGIQYLVQNGVLKVPQASSGNIKQQSLPVMAPTNVNPNSSNEGLNFHGQLIKNADTDDYSFILNMIPSSSSQRIYYMWSDSQGEALIHDIYSQLQ
ncbi:MAG: hypothetical protein KGH88_09735, partial [Thaumarchaeota archaeon]|nr:hypothetical protein [Nitrososphaerota archaeon]